MVTEPSMDETAFPVIAKEGVIPPVYESGEDIDKATAYKIEAFDLKSAGDYESAMDKYTFAIQAAPPSALLLANRADCLFRLKRYKAAIHDCDSALEKNADSAKALRIRGRSYSAIDKYEEARQDLSASQSIDYDDLAAEDLKMVSKKVREIETLKVKKRLEEEEKMRKRAEEIKKVREEAKREAKTEEAKPKASMPGNMGGMEGLSGLMGTLFNDPEIADGMKNPKVAAAFSDMMSGGGFNAAKLTGLMADPEVGPVVQKLIAKLGPMMGAMGGRNPGGMSEESDGIDDGVPDLDDIPNL